MTPKTETTRKETCEMFEKSADTLKSAMDAGIKVQQDAFKTVGDMFTKGGSFDGSRQRFETVATDSIDLVRRNAEQAQRYFDESCRNNMNVVKKSFDFNRDAGDQDVFVRTRDFWQTACDATRSNFEAATKAGSQAIENWSNFVGKTLATTEKK
jgi:hypothetical protein